MDVSQLCFCAICRLLWCWTRRAIDFHRGSDNLRSVPQGNVSKPKILNFVFNETSCEGRAYWNMQRAIFICGNPVWRGEKVAKYGTLYLIWNSAVTIYVF